MSTYEDEGRAPLIIDTTFHATDRIPVDIGASLTISGGIELDAGDIQIGAVELKDATTANRAIITVEGDLHVTLDSEVVAVDATGQGDVPITLDGEIVQISGVVLQELHDNLNVNANLQVGDADVSSTNRVPVDLDSGITVLRTQIAASSASNELVAAVGGEQIKVLSLLLMVSDTVSGRFRSAAGGNYLSGNLSLDATGAGFAIMPPADPSMHWIETAAGEALVLELSDSAYVGGMLTYYTE